MLIVLLGAALLLLLRARNAQPAKLARQDAPPANDNSQPTPATSPAQANEDVPLDNSEPSAPSPQAEHRIAVVEEGMSRKVQHAILAHLCLHRRLACLRADEYATAIAPVELVERVVALRLADEADVAERVEHVVCVATLFMTQASYDDPNNFNYLQTSAYQARNPQDMNDLPHLQAFVTDLYHAFLQREPDTSGLNFWVATAQQEGRKKVIRAFEVSIEFGDLVNQLFDGGPPQCCTPRRCPRGMFFDPDTCSCEPL